MVEEETLVREAQKVRKRKGKRIDWVVVVGSFYK